MLNKIIKLLTKTASKLQDLERIYQRKMQEYSSPQCKTTAIVCCSLGLLLGFAIGKII